MNIKALVSSIRYGSRKSYKRYKFKGLFNYFLSLIDINLGLPLCVAKPTALYLTIVEGICNFSCKMCPPAPQGHKKEISFESFKKIFDSCKYVNMLNFSAWGEPFLVKDIFKIITYVKMQNCEAEAITNMSLVNEAVARKIIESRLDRLSISFDAAEPEVFERIRQGAKFQTILDNIKALNRLKADCNSKNPELSFIITTMKENISQLTKIIELAHQLGIKKVIINPLKIFDMGLATQEQSLTNFPELTQNIFKAAKNRAKELGVSLISPDYRRYSRKGLVCKQPWYALNVLMDGTIRPCCSYYPVLGNMFKEGINGVWNNKDFRLIRRTVKKESSMCYWCLQALNKLELV